MTTIKKNYEWRNLTCDGLLKRVEARGPYYDEDESLKCGSWTTEEDAVAALVRFVDRHETSEEFVLVASYEISLENAKGDSQSPDK
jgi:hypothetical protein